MSTCPTTPLGRSQCAQKLIDLMAGGFNGQPGCEVTATTARPIIVGPHGVNGYICPHGVEYFIEPTSEQIADWAERGVA
jgi:hypothetical protein